MVQSATCSARLSENGKPWMLYPFRAVQFLTHEIPVAVCHTWQSNYQASNGSIYLICELDGHWLLLVGSPTGLRHQIQWTLHDGLRQSHLLRLIAKLAQKLSHLLDLDFLGLTMGTGLLQAHASTCGTVALVQMALELRLTKVDEQDDLQELHHWLLERQPAGSSSVGGSTLPHDIHTKLATMLEQHGVPAEALPDRVKQVIQKLGPNSVKEAFEAKNCWAYLKAVASRPSISMRLVLPDELSRHVVATAATKFGAKVNQPKNKKKKKSEHKVPPRPLNPDPEHLVLMHTSFQDSDGDIVEQISFEEVEAEACGIAICTLAQAYHFLQSTQSISTRPLAILTTERPPADFMDEHDISAVSFAAKYTGTGEPILIFGAMKNLGDILITRHIPGTVEQPALIETQVIKVQVFRDEHQVTGSNWPNLQCAPSAIAVPRLNYALAKNVALTVRNPMQQLLLEIWSRTFTKLEGGKIPAADAQIFGVFLRIPASILDAHYNVGPRVFTLNQDQPSPKAMMSAIG